MSSTLRREGTGSAPILQAAYAAISRADLTGGAEAAKKAIRAVLESQGWTVAARVPAPLPKDKRSRLIALVAERPGCPSLAVEVDRRTLRDRSRLTLGAASRRWGCLGIAVLRNPMPGFSWLGGWFPPRQ